MCGIVVAVRPATPASDLPPILAVEQGLDRMRHRGPDGSGGACVRVPGRPDCWETLLGQRRLAVVGGMDVEVPYRYPDIGVTLAFNGEIYNWRDLRAELGGEWATECDAEVIARAWKRWGEDCLRRFNGDFAFVLVDVSNPAEPVAFAARDRAGVKPLYWTRTADGEVWFASEIKALPVEFRPQPVTVAEVLEFDCLEHTRWCGVQSLLPAHAVLMRLDRMAAPVMPRPWWRLPEPAGAYADEPAIRTAGRVLELLEDAVRIRCRPERPTTLLLSGGLDSAILQRLARYDVAYCLTFPGTPFDVEEEARAAARPGTDLRFVTFGKDDLLRDLDRIAWHLDTPAIWTAACQWALFSRIRQDGFAVVLSGEGADELFGGYTRYRVLHWIQRMVDDPRLDGYGPTIQHLVGGLGESLVAKMIDRSPGGCLGVVARDLVTRFGGDGDLVAMASRVEWHTTMQVLLRIADRMSSAFGVEARPPFLDYRLAELLATLPPESRVNDRESKSVLREVGRLLGVSPRITEERAKKGFTIPWPQWFPEARTGSRGAWDRGLWVQMADAAWRRAFAGHGV